MVRYWSMSSVRAISGAKAWEMLPACCATCAHSIRPTMDSGKYPCCLPAFLPTIVSEMRWDLAKARPEPIEIDAVPGSFLHTDIGPGNIVVAKDTGRLVAIDWQCPAIGDPVQDVIAFLSPAFQILYGRRPLSDTEEAAFFAAYDDPELKQRYDKLLPFYDWRMAGYCATRQIKYASTRPEASQRYADALTALLERL